MNEVLGEVHVLFSITMLKRVINIYQSMLTMNARNFISYLDASNLYSMPRPLPYKDFKWVETLPQEFIKNSMRIVILMIHEK